MKQTKRFALISALLLTLGAEWTFAQTGTPKGPHTPEHQPTLTVESPNTVPQIGAQIWVEPGMDAKTIDQQFETLAKLDMPVTRLFMVWNWMETARGVWDFDLYDQCFASAQRHGVKIVATLMPNQAPTYVGPAGYYKVQDGAAAHTEQELAAQAQYIKAVVTHFGAHPALDTWMLMNEPGQLPSPDPLALAKFGPWLKAKYNNDLKALNTSWLTGYTSFDSVQSSPSWAGGGWTWPGAYVDWNVFWRDHLTWYMRWIATEIRKYDSKSDLHINPHALLDIQEKYDLPQWSDFLTSLGCSVHPVWHFDALKRNQYGNGVSFVSDYIRGSAKGKPFWVTELQGGINLYTGTNALTPTPAEIERWLWSGIGAGAQRTIFWCLNPRLKGTEAGEWAMVDYQYRPTARLLAASKVAKSLKANPTLWTAAQPVLPQIYVVQSQETMVLQGRAKVNQGDNLVRTQRAHKNAVLGTYLGLQRLGVAPQVLNVSQMDWLAKDRQAKLAILPHATALTNSQLEQMLGFVTNGGTLILTGLTGLYDDYETLRYTSASPLKQLMGANVVAIEAYTPFGKSAALKSMRLRLNKLADRSLSSVYGDSVWVSQFGKGTVITIGAPAGLDQYADVNQTAFTSLLAKVSTQTKTLPTIHFQQANPDVYLRQMQSGNSEISILTNTSTTNTSSVLLEGLVGKKPTDLYGGAIISKQKSGDWQITLRPDATFVIKWD